MKKESKKNEDVEEDPKKAVKKITKKEDAKREEEESTETEETVKREEILVFHKDDKGNHIARLSNGESIGKIVLHHRKDTVEIIEGLEYRCLVEEKPHWCFAWVLGINYYPRIVLKNDRTCIGMENNKTRKLYPDVYKAISDLKTRTKRNYVLLITNEETKESQW